MPGDDCIGGAPVARMEGTECVAPSDVPREAAAVTTDVPMAEVMHAAPCQARRAAERRRRPMRRDGGGAERAGAEGGALSAAELQAAAAAARALARSQPGGISKPKKKRDQKSGSPRDWAAKVARRAPLSSLPDNGGAAGGSAALL